ncbi:MAG: hotdog fold thioesterase [Usitatibacteraceae bacterium]
MTSTSIWHQRPNLADFNLPTSSMVDHLGIEMIEIGDDFVIARMPVDARTVQPMTRVLHGGASVALAETLGSTGAYLTIDPAKFIVAGIEINANHVRSVREGWVTGVARPIHRGRTTQIWDIRITDAADKLVCVSRLTVAVMERPAK